MLARIVKILVSRMVWFRVQLMGVLDIYIR